ncbi:MAG: hypothetical protein R3F59_21700 [Myxococcota bacterium]
MSRPADAMSTALDRTRHVLFDPFDGAKYVGLAFCVWLSQVGSVAGNSSSWSARNRGGNGSGSPFDPHFWKQVTDFLQQWGALLVAGGLLLLVVGIAVWALLTFLQSRGLFMTIDNLVNDRGAVQAPWSAWAAEADALFRFRLSVGLAAGAVGLAAAGLAGFGVWLTWTGVPDGTHLGLLVVAGAISGAAALAAALADWSATEFVAPLMYVRRYGVADGFRDLRAMLGADLGGFLVYVLLKVVAGLGVGFLTVALTCMTCGLTLLPFLGTLILLPLFVFLRTFALAFVAQQADDLAVLTGA